MAATDATVARFWAAYHCSPRRDCGGAYCRQAPCLCRIPATVPPVGSAAHNALLYLTDGHTLTDAESGVLAALRTTYTLPTTTTDERH